MILNYRWLDKEIGVWVRAPHRLKFRFYNLREATNIFLWHEIVSGSILKQYWWFDLFLVIYFIIINDDITFNLLLLLGGVKTRNSSSIGSSDLLCLFNKKVYTILLKPLLATIIAFLFHRHSIIACFIRFTLIRLMWSVLLWRRWFHKGEGGVEAGWIVESWRSYGIILDIWSRDWGLE